MDLTKYIEEHHFVFDQVYDEAITNHQLYEDTVQPLVSAAFQGSKVTWFAYGQTGSGKTFTMMGPPQVDENSVPGMYLLAANDIFTLMEDASISDFSISISFYEIYWGKLLDLLNQRKLVNAREDAKGRVKIMGLTEATVTSVEETMQVINFGLESRTVGETAANADSSRSHAIMQLSIKQPDGKTYGKLSFIDLAGNERGADTSDNIKQTRMDGAEINKSLLALKECIRALDQSKGHIPFRGSKLTMVLKDSFQGRKCKTVMITNVSPVMSCCENTLNTLRYADRVKELKSDKSSKEKANELMLPRQKTKTVKYDYKKPNETPKSNLTGLAAIQQNIQNNKLTKSTSSKPQNVFQNNPNSGQQKLLDESSGASRLNKMDKMRKAKTHAYNDKPQYQNLKKNQDQGTPSHDGQFSKQKSGRGPVDDQTHVSQIQSRLRMPQAKSEIARPKTGMPQQRQQPLQDRDEYIDYDDQQQYDEPEPDNLAAAPNDNFKEKHEALVNKILQEEDELLGSHKTFIDSTVNLVKDEMNLLHEVDKPGSDVEQYIANLDVILKSKMDMIHTLRSKLSGFYDNIKEEQEMSSAFQEMQNQGDGNPPEPRNMNELDNLDKIDHLDQQLDNDNIEDNLLAGDDMLMDEIGDELGGFKISDY